jgi:hypothetical protein
VPLVGLVLASAWVVGCGEGGRNQARAGSALNMPAVSMTIESVPLPVGQEWDHTEIDIINVSHSPVVLRRVVVVGTGVGRTARVLNVWAAPIGAPVDTVPSALYHRLPPAFALPHHGGCAVQTLHPLRGFVLAAGRTMRFLTLLRALRPGRFHNTGYDVFYEQAGTLFHQLIPIGFTATVRAGVGPFPLEPWERACGHTSTRLLPGLT